jgi:hypothetical protein
VATLQFLSGLRRPAASVASDKCAETEMTCAGKVIDEQDHQMRSGANSNNAMHGVASQPQPGICSVGHACAAFQEAQDALVALTSQGDDMDSGGLSELRARRNETFKELREMAALTRCAVQAKLRVLSVVGHWFGEDSPDVCSFAMDVAFEAAALLDSDPDQTCSCHHPQIEAAVDQAGSPSRSPFAWFVRPRRRTADTPFAN